MDTFNQTPNMQQYQQTSQVQPQAGQVQIPVNNTIAFAGQQQVQPQPNQNNQRLFTQDEVNRIVSERVNPLTQKNQELTSQVNTLQTSVNGYLSELTGLKQASYLGSVGVPTGFTDYVKFEASKLAVNGIGFEQAVSSFLSSPQGMIIKSLSGQTVSQQVNQSGVQSQGSAVGSPSSQVIQQGQVNNQMQSNQQVQQVGAVNQTGVQGQQQVTGATQQSNGVANTNVGSTGFTGNNTGSVTPSGDDYVSILKNKKMLK